MDWDQLLNLIREVCAAQGEERRVLLVLADIRYHVHEPLSLTLGEGGLLGFSVFSDDPERSQRTPATRLLFVAPAQVLRVVIEGQEGGGGAGFGFVH